jgi:hypothetical protein
MQSRGRSITPTARSTAGRTHKFKVVVAFDDHAVSSSSALKTCDYVLQQLGDIPVTRRIVNLNQTRTPRSRAAAARDAAGADMVIVSTRDGSELPGDMQTWLDEWSTKRSADEGALVAILTRTADQTDSGARERLAQLAQQMHMDFISSEVAA